MAEAKVSQQVTRVVHELLVDEFEVDAAKLTPEARLGEDLGLDSLDGVDLVVALEKAFTTRIPEAEARAIRTLGDIYDQIHRRLEQGGQVEV